MKGALLMQWSALALMALGVYLAPPEQRGLALVLAAGLYFNTPFRMEP